MPKNSRGIRCTAVVKGKQCTGRTRVVLVRRTVGDTNLRRMRECKLCGKVRESLEAWMDEPARLPKRRKQAVG